MSKKKIETTQLKAKLFCGFGDASRLSILESLRVSELSVSDIVEKTGLSQSNVSNHLGCLRECGLVSAKQSGRYVYYSLSSSRVGELLSLADEILDGISESIDVCESYPSAKKMRKHTLSSVK